MDVYDNIRDCAAAVVDGFNATVFAYGQTGSGKTHTMFGPQQHIQSLVYGSTPSMDSGVIPRAIMDIFNLGAQAENTTEFAVYCSFVQIYNESLFDMLRDPDRSRPLEVHEDHVEGIYVEGLSEYSVRDFGDCMDLLRMGEENRAIRETHMNQASSRSHSIFQIVVEQKREGDGGEVKQFRSKFNLVDLAGSEKWDINQEMGTDRVSEMTNINLSLYTLGRCIAALAKAARGGNGRGDHVPYRESKLTRILQDSLGGNAKTRVIATLSPASDCIDESVSTLKFADRAKQVMVFVRRNENRPVDHALVQRLQREVAHLRALLDQYANGGTPPAEAGIGDLGGRSPGGGESSGFCRVRGDVAQDTASSSSDHWRGQAEAAAREAAEMREENDMLRQRLGIAPQHDTMTPTRMGMGQASSPRGFPSLPAVGNNASSLTGGSGSGQKKRSSEASYNSESR